MIFRLINFEHSWKALLALWVFVLLVAFGILTSLRAFEMAILTGSFLMLFPSRLKPRCSPLQAALPICARDLFVAGLLLQLIICWSYNLTLAAAAKASHFEVTGWALNTSAITTVGLIALYSVRTHESNIPRSSKWIIALVTYAVVSAVLGIHYKPKPAVPPIYVLPACALAAVVLFWMTWVSFPETFEIAPRESVEPRWKKNWFRWWKRPELPFLRSFGGKGSIALSCALVVFGWIGTVFFGIVFVFFSFFRTIARLRTAERWLFLLPISRRTLFATTILPPLGLFALGSLIGLCLSSQPPREVTLNVAVVAAASLLALFAVEIPSLVRRLGAGWILLLTCTASFSVAWAVWRWCRSATGTSATKTLPIEAILGNVLPHRLSLLIATSVAGVAALYLLAYAGFCRMEIKPQRPTVS